VQEAENETEAVKRLVLIPHNTYFIPQPHFSSKTIRNSHPERYHTIQYSQIQPIYQTIQSANQSLLYLSVIILLLIVASSSSSLLHLNFTRFCFFTITSILLLSTFNFLSTTTSILMLLKCSGLTTRSAEEEQ